MTNSLISTLDCHPFGMRLWERSANSSSYRYGFNGMEEDKEIKGSGNSYTTEFRQYDPRVGIWLSVDPLSRSFAWQSPYCAMDNNPMYYNDPKGAAAASPKDNKSDKNKRNEELEEKYGEELPMVDLEGFSVVGNKPVRQWLSKVLEKIKGFFNAKGTITLVGMDGKVDAAAIKGPSEYQVNVDLLKVVTGAGAKAGPKKFGEGWRKNLTSAFTKGHGATKQAIEEIEKYKNKLDNPTSSDVNDQVENAASDTHKIDSTDVLVIYELPTESVYQGPRIGSKRLTVATKDLVNDTLKGEQYGDFDGSVKLKKK